MRTAPLSWAALGLAMLLGLAVVPARADDDDHDRARAAVVAGQVLPLNEVLQRVGRQHPGQVLEVELEQKDGRWIYELKLLQARGGLLKLDVDARDGQVLRQREKSRGRD